MQSYRLPEGKNISLSFFAFSTIRRPLGREKLCSQHLTALSVLLRGRRWEFSDTAVLFAVPPCKVPLLAGSQGWGSLLRGFALPSSLPGSLFAFMGTMG